MFLAATPATAALCPEGVAGVGFETERSLDFNIGTRPGCRKRGLIGPAAVVCTITTLGVRGSNSCSESTGRPGSSPIRSRSQIQVVGTLGRTRTANPLIRSQILYPLSYEGTLRVYRDAFLRSLSAENKSVRTRQSYGEAIGLLTAFLRTHGMPTAPEAISREHLTAWVNGMLVTRKAATAANRYRGASRFFISCLSCGRVVSEPARGLGPGFDGFPEGATTDRP